MPCKIHNNSSMNVTDLNPLAQDLVSYMQKKAGFKRPPSAITYTDDKDNAENILGKTAYYDPNSASVTIYVTGRHPKDILRSLAHELVHHRQNERGEFDDIGPVGEGYAQSDKKLRNMEREAYTMGNMCFRDWEDGRKNAIMESIYKQQQILRRNKTMEIHKWKNSELNKLLMEKFGLKGDKKKLNEWGYHDQVQHLADHYGVEPEVAEDAVNMIENGMDEEEAIKMAKRKNAGDPQAGEEGGPHPKAPMNEVLYRKKVRKMLSEAFKKRRK